MQGYPSSERAALPSGARAAHTISETDNTFTMGPAPRKLISFGELNLMNAWPMKGSFDVILCRNVAIYFNAATQSRLWSRFVDQLKPGVHLMIGHSERLSGPATDSLRGCGVTTYQKMPGGTFGLGRTKDDLQ